MTFRIALLLVAISSTAAFPLSSQAAFLTFTNQAGFNAAVAGLGPGITHSTNFDSTLTGNKTSSFSIGSLTFTGSTEVSGPLAPLDLGVNAAAPVGTTTSGTNYLGINGGFGDFQGGFLNAGNVSASDRLTITIPANLRALGFNIITDTVSDGVNSFGRLTGASATVDTPASLGTDLGNGFRSYFVGIVGQLAGDVLPSGTVSFVGGTSFFRIDDVTAFAVPEPTSLALVGVAGLAGLIRRRVRRS